MKIGAIITARMGSSRLYGKSMAVLAGRPSLWHIITRLKKSRFLEEIVVATTTKKEDDVICNFAIKKGATVFRGSSDDVLGRVLKAAKKFGLDTIVLITGDCPMIDTKIVDLVVKKYLEKKPDYASNRLNPKTSDYAIPPGLDVQVFSTKLLENINGIADMQAHEHVTLYFYQHPEKYNVLNVAVPKKLSRPDLRFCIDTKEDLLFAQKVFGELFTDKKPFFYAEEVMDLLAKRPELAEINSQVLQKKPWIDKTK
jgi:spore coat polysaccharide biosynthesis protein SpsF